LSKFSKRSHNIRRPKTVKMLMTSLLQPMSEGQRESWSPLMPLFDQLMQYALLYNAVRLWNRCCCIWQNDVTL